MIDLHTHVLPGIDDGPETIEDALALAKAIVADGVRHAVLTPHVYPGRWNNTRTSLQQQFELFQASLLRLGIPLSVSLGGEVRLNDGVLDLLAQDEIPTLGTYQGLKTMLLELPDATIPLGSDKLARYLIDKGYCPIIVHPERNKAVMEKPERLRPFVDMGCQIQVTAGSVLGEFGRNALTTAQALFDRDWVNLLASDCHNLRGRAPRMAAARAWAAAQLGERKAWSLCFSQPAKLCSQPIPTQA